MTKLMLWIEMRKGVVVTVCYCDSVEVFKIVKSECLLQVFPFLVWIVILSKLYWSINWIKNCTNICFFFILRSENIVLSEYSLFTFYYVRLRWASLIARQTKQHRSASDWLCHSQIVHVSISLTMLSSLHFYVASRPARLFVLCGPIIEICTPY